MQPLGGKTPYPLAYVPLNSRRHSAPRLVPCAFMSTALSFDIEILNECMKECDELSCIILVKTRLVFYLKILSVK